MRIIKCLSKMLSVLRQLYLDQNGTIERRSWWLGIFGIFLAQFFVTAIVRFLVFESAASSFAVGVCQLVGAAILFIPLRTLITKRLRTRGRPEPLFWAFFIPGVAVSIAMALGIAGIVDSAANYSPNLLGQVLIVFTHIATIWMFIELGILSGRKSQPAATTTLNS